MNSMADDPGPPVELDPPQTLADTQRVVACSRPRQKAPLSEWLAYHQRAAAWYAEVADIDRGHHHEALAMAEEQRQFVMKIKPRFPYSDLLVRRKTDDRNQDREPWSAPYFDAGS